MKTASGILFISVIGLMALGVVALVSASTGKELPRQLMMHPFWCLIGLGACGMIAWRDYRWLSHVSLFGLGVSVILLVMVFVPPFGEKLNGSHRWLDFGPVLMQPSEFAKLALILVLAHYGAHYQSSMKRFRQGVFIPIAIMVPVIGLVFAEPDVGAAVLMAGVGGVMLVVAGTRLRFLVTPALIVGVALACFLWQNPHRSARIYSWLNLEETRDGMGMQVYNSIMAMGQGGVEGVGLGEGGLKLSYVPENHNDFIFSVIGEELGLVATLGVVVGYLAIVLSGLYIAWHARETFGMLLATGITTLIGFQAIINIGVVTGTIPNKGLALPFISYGGSNMVSLMIGIGLLLNVARYGKPRRKRDELPLPQSDILSYQYL